MWVARLAVGGGVSFIAAKWLGLLCRPSAGGAGGELQEVVSHRISKSDGRSWRQNVAFRFRYPLVVIDLLMGSEIR